jgi:aminoglycoside phosphotransferase (APT) family kinase protein
VRHAYRLWKRYRSMLKKLRSMFKHHKVHVIPAPVDVAQAEQDYADEGAFVCFDFVNDSVLSDQIEHPPCCLCQ